MTNTRVVLMLLLASCLASLAQSQWTAFSDSKGRFKMLLPAGNKLMGRRNANGFPIMGAIYAWTSSRSGSVNLSTLNAHPSQHREISNSVPLSSNWLDLGGRQLGTSGLDWKDSR